jgi:hypothetical protein
VAQQTHLSRENLAAIDAYLPLAAATIKARREKLKLNPVAIPTFRGAALEAQSCTASEWLTSGPAETGKTFGDLYRLDTLLRTTPKSRASIVRKVRADMAASVLQTWEQVIEIRGGVTKFGGENAVFYSYENGARCYVVGLDNPGKVLSSERDWIYVNQAEQLFLEDWETLSTRVTGRSAHTLTPMLFGDCNPGVRTHWIRERKSLHLIESRHEDNPTLYDDDGEITARGEATMRVLDALTGIRKERLRFGRWASAAGAVYEFDRAANLIKRSQVPSIIRYVGSIDFGYKNPFVAQLWGLDHDGRMYLLREIYWSERIVEDHAGRIKTMVKRELEGNALTKRIEWVSDHDSEDRATLDRHGVPTIAAFKAITPGIQAVQARLAKAGDGKPRLYVVEDATVEIDEKLVSSRRPVSTEIEFEGYIYPSTVNGKSDKEEPMDADNHGMDACRYAVAYVDRISSECVPVVGATSNPITVIRGEFGNAGGIIL